MLIINEQAYRRIVRGHNQANFCFWNEYATKAISAHTKKTIPIHT